MRNSIKLLAFFASARLSFFPNSRPVIAERVTGCDFDFDFVFEAILFVDCCGGEVTNTIVCSSLVGWRWGVRGVKFFERG